MILFINIKLMNALIMTGLCRSNVALPRGMASTKRISVKFPLALVNPMIEPS